MPTLQDFLASAQKGVGLSGDQARGATAGVLSFLQSKLGAADFGKLAAALPGASDLAAGAASAPAGGGLGGALGGLAQAAGGVLGGGGGAAAGLLEVLAKAGVTPDKALQFLPMLGGFLKGNLAPDLLKGVAAKAGDFAKFLA